MARPLAARPGVDLSGDGRFRYPFVQGALWPRSCWFRPGWSVSRQSSPVWGSRWYGTGGGSPAGDNLHCGDAAVDILQ